MLPEDNLLSYAMLHNYASVLAECFGLGLTVPQALAIATGRSLGDHDRAMAEAMQDLYSVTGSLEESFLASEWPDLFSKLAWAGEAIDDLGASFAKGAELYGTSLNEFLALEEKFLAEDLDQGRFG